MKKIITTIGLLIIWANISYAEDIWIMAVINSQNEIYINSDINLDWSESLIKNWEEVEYKWSIENWGQNKIWEKVAISSWKKWKKTIVLTVKQGESISKTQKDIIVFDKKITLITNKVWKSQIKEIENQAWEQWVFLKIIKIDESWSNFANQENALKSLIENKTFIENSKFVIFETNNFNWAEIFKKFAQNLDEKSWAKLQNKFYIKISEWNLSVDKQISEKYFNQWSNPENILITRKESLNIIFKNDNLASIKDILEKRWIDFMQLSKNSQISKIFILSNFISKLINEWISLNAIYMILCLPFIAFIVVFFRQVIWLSSFWVYIPTITALSFFILWIKLWLIIILFVVFLSYLIRNIINKIELPFVPQVALMLSLISLSFFFLFWISISFKVNIPIELAIFPMLVISTIAEKFIWSQSAEWMKWALLNMFQTILISVIWFLFVNMQSIHNLIISIPELVLVPLILTILIWKFTGLRISEYIRFKTLLTEWSEE